MGTRLSFLKGVRVGGASMAFVLALIASSATTAQEPDEPSPWRPFRARGESFAPAPMNEQEIAEEAAANRRRTERERERARMRVATKQAPAGSLSLSDPRALRGESGDYGVVDDPYGEPVYDEPIWDEGRRGSSTSSMFGGTTDSFAGGDELDGASAAAKAQRVRKAASPLGPFLRGPQGVGYRFYPERDVKGTGERFQSQIFDFNIGAPLYSGDNQAVILTAQVEPWVIRTNARLRNSNVAFPSELWNIDLGLIHTVKWANGWDSMVRVAGGTATDRPFNRFRDSTFMFLGTVRVPTYNEDNAWRFTILSMTNGPLGRYVPIPGIAYEFKTSETFRGVIGVPAWFDWQPRPGMTVSMAYLPMVDFLAQVRQELDPWNTVWIGYSSRSQSWLRNDREDAETQLFYFEQDIGAGWQMRLTEQLGVQAVAGYGFGRRFGEGRTYSNLPRNNVHIEPGAYVGLQGGILF